MTSKADIYALSLLNGQKEDYKLNEYNWNTIFDVSPIGTTERLIKNELLQLSSNPELTLPKLLVPDLKKILKDNCQKVSGRKADLINRILSNVNLDILQNTITFKVFDLTPTGKKLLYDNSSVPIIAKYFNNSSITFKNAELVGIKANDSNPKQIITKIINYFYELYLSNKEWNKVYDILIDKENSERSFNHVSADEKIDTYLQLIYLSISGQSSNFDNSSLENKLKYLNSVDELINYECSIPSYYIEDIQKIKSGTELTDKDIFNHLKSIELTFNDMESTFSNEEIEKLIVLSLLGNKNDQIDSIYLKKYEYLKENVIQTEPEEITSEIKINISDQILSAENHKINNQTDKNKKEKTSNNTKTNEHLLSKLIKRLIKF